MEVTATQRLDWDQCWDFHQQDSHPIGIESLVWIERMRNTHTLTTTTTGSKNSPKEVNDQTDNQNNALCAPKVPSLLVLGCG